MMSLPDWRENEETRRWIRPVGWGNQVQMCVCVCAAAGRILLRKSRTSCHPLWPQHQDTLTHARAHTQTHRYIKGCAASTVVVWGDKQQQHLTHKCTHTLGYTRTRFSDSPVQTHTLTHLQSIISHIHTYKQTHTYTFSHTHIHTH